MGAMSSGSSFVCIGHPNSDWHDYSFTLSDRWLHLWQLRQAFIGESPSTSPRAMSMDGRCRQSGAVCRPLTSPRAMRMRHRSTSEVFKFLSTHCTYLPSLACQCGNVQSGTHVPFAWTASRVIKQVP